MISGAARVAPEKAVFRPALPMSSLPGISEMQMATMTYREQLLHPNWQKKRLEVMEDAGFQCENCGDKETTLNVHHGRYVKGRKVWEYERNELKCLCQPCHQAEHAHREQLDLLLMQPEASLPAIVALIAGFLDGQCGLDVPFDAGDLQAEFDTGILASILYCQMPDALSRAHEAAGVLQLTPPQESAAARWREFADKLERSGL